MNMQKEVWKEKHGRKEVWEMALIGACVYAAHSLFFPVA